jgi:hypothetical protein
VARYAAYSAERFCASCTSHPLWIHLLTGVGDSESVSRVADKYIIQTLDSTLIPYFQKCVDLIRRQMTEQFKAFHHFSAKDYRCAISVCEVYCEIEVCNCTCVHVVIIQTLVW